MNLNMNICTIFFIAMEKANSIQTIDSIILSDYILKNYGPMSHLKLQKLLFYCDAYCLAYTGEELVTDEFEAWVHGPVSRKVYANLKDVSILYADLTYVDKGIDVDAEFDKLNSSKKDVVKEVLRVLSTWTGLQLESSTHKEQPWIEARAGYGQGEKCNTPISKATTRSFYEQEING